MHPEDILLGWCTVPCDAQPSRPDTGQTHSARTTHPIGHTSPTRPAGPGSPTGPRCTTEHRATCGHRTNANLQARSTLPRHDHQLGNQWADGAGQHGATHGLSQSSPQLDMDCSFTELLKRNLHTQHKQLREPSKNARGSQESLGAPGATSLVDVLDSRGAPDGTLRGCCLHRISPPPVFPYLVCFFLFL